MGVGSGQVPGGTGCSTPPPRSRTPRSGLWPQRMDSTAGMGVTAPQSGGEALGHQGASSPSPSPGALPHLQQGSPQNEIPHQGDLLSVSGLQKGLGRLFLKASLPTSHAPAWAGSRSPHGSHRKPCFSPHPRPAPSRPLRTFCLSGSRSSIPWSVSWCLGDIQERC